MRVHLFELLGSSERKWGVAGVWKRYPVELQERARLHFPYTTYYHVESVLQKRLKRQDHPLLILTSENENLRMKLLKVKHQRDEAVDELEKIKEQRKVDELLRNYVTTRDIYVQTEPRLAYPALPKQKKKEDTEDTDINKTSKMLSMHSQLMKRYEKELKQNMTHIETIANLNLNIADLEKRLKEKTDEISGIERELKLLQIQVRSRSRLKKVRGRAVP